jgi:hypothetical protein
MHRYIHGWRVGCRRILARGAIALLLAPALAVPVNAVVGYTSSSAACPDPIPYEYMPTSPGPSFNIPAVDTDLAARKAELISKDFQLQADLQTAIAKSLEARAMKAAFVARAAALPRPTIDIDQACGSRALRGSLLQALQKQFVVNAAAADSVTRYTDHGYDAGYLNNMNQQAQQCNSICNQYPVVNYFCGPATIAEETTTESVAIDQPTAASDMGSTKANGTSNTAMTTEMQNKLGWPEMGGSWYVWQGVSGSPTSTEISNFRSNLWVDVVYGMPVSGDAYEVGGNYPDGSAYPHLNGHPNITMKHWFEIGGEDYYTDVVWMADSIYGAGTAGIFSPNNVPQFSWFRTYYTNSHGYPFGMVEILGGLGYIW